MLTMDNNVIFVTFFYNFSLKGTVRTKTVVHSEERLREYFTVSSANNFAQMCLPQNSLRALAQGEIFEGSIISHEQMGKY